MRCGWRLVTCVLAALASACAVNGRAAPDPATRTLVAVFAHPDDETLVAAALAHYARLGAKVYLVTVTDGRKGTSTHAKIPAGDSLAKVRADETRCSARALGIQPPILLGFEDAGLAVLSPWPGEPIDRLATRLDTLFRELRPDAVITWGPEGGYGHQDHRLVGDAVMQLFQAGAVAPSARLFFAGFTADRTTTAPLWFGHHIYPTAPSLLTASVAIDDSDRAAARRALSCHWSQATPEEMNESFAAMRHLWRDELRFQEWRGGRRSTGLF